MKTKYQFIHFSNDGEYNGKPAWNCLNNRSKSLLGIVVWYPSWNQYIFSQSTESVVWSKGCLLDVIDFMGQLK